MPEYYEDATFITCHIVSEVLVEMINFNEALKKVLLFANNIMNTETIELMNSLNRILAEPVTAEINIPHFERSPLDGFAMRSEDTKNASKLEPVQLEIIDTIEAGDTSKIELNKNEVARVMTGAQIPSNADCVTRFEEVVELENIIEVFKSFRSGENVVPPGEDVEKGSEVFRDGDVLKPADIGLLAALGNDLIKVYSKPKVAIITTGRELLNISDELEPGKVRNINNVMLHSLVEEYGGIPISWKVVPDTADGIADILREELQRSDLIITSGSVSAGGQDHIPAAFSDIEASILFRRVAVKPGSPLTVAQKDGKLFFALSGNPGACLVNFEQFVAPVLLKAQGRRDYNPVYTKAILTEDLDLGKKQHLLFLAARCFYDQEGRLYVTPHKNQMPGSISPYHDYNCYIVTEANGHKYCKDDVIDIHLLKVTFPLAVSKTPGLTKHPVSVVYSA